MSILINILRKLKYLQEPLVRDFTEDAEKEMVRLANAVSEADNDLVSKYITDPFGRWLDKMGCLDILFGIENYQKNVIDHYNYSAENIRSICDQARHFDALYGNEMAQYASQADRVYRLVMNLAECLDPSSSAYSEKQPVSDRILSFSNKWVEGEDGDKCQISDLDDEARQQYFSDKQWDEISEEEVVEFCSDSDVVNLFDEYKDYIYETGLDWSALDLVFLTGGTVIYKGVEMTIDEAIGLISKEGYSDKMVREQLDAIISSVISGQSTAKTFMKDHETAKETVEGLIKDYLEDKDNDSAFKDFVEAMGGITAVKELAEKSPALIDYLFTDYKKGLEILDNISKTGDRSGCVEMREAVEKLRADYNSKWVGILHKTQEFSEDMIKELSQEGLEEWIEDQCGDASVILSVLKATDLESQVDGYHTLLALRKVQSDLQMAYEDAIGRIQSGEYTEEDLNYARNMFDMLKETTKKIYETYRDMCETDASKQIWCNDQIENLERMTMQTYSPYGFESP